MTAVNATIRVDILDSDESYFLNVTHGRMQAGEDASHPPFMTLRQSLGAYHRIASEAGDSAMALLGGLSGLAGEMKLTQQRIDNLADVKGLMKFVVLGERGFELLTHFGTDPIPDEPATSIHERENRDRRRHAAGDAAGPGRDLAGLRTNPEPLPQLVPGRPGSLSRARRP
jgi:hypothetical protein